MKAVEDYEVFSTLGLWINSKVQSVFKTKAAEEYFSVAELACTLSVIFVVSGWFPKA